MSNHILTRGLSRTNSATIMTSGYVFKIIKFRNHIITRGLSRTNSATIMTRGYAENISVIQKIQQQFSRIIKYGKSNSKKIIDDSRKFIIEASLIEVNSNELNNPITSKIMIIFSGVRNVVISIMKATTRVVKQTRKNIVITAQRVK